MENSKLNLIGNILRYAIGIIGVILIAVIFAGNTAAIGAAITFTTIVIAIGAIAAVVFGVMFVAGNVQAAKPLLIGVVGFIAVMLLSYVLASGAIEAHWLTINDFPVPTEGESKMVGAGLISFYAFFAIAVIAIVYTEVMSIIK